MGVRRREFHLLNCGIYHGECKEFGDNLYFEKKSSVKIDESAVRIDIAGLSQLIHQPLKREEIPMIGTTAGSATFVSTPKVELEPPKDLLPKVDLYHVAYFRDNTDYDTLMKALLQKVSGMQKHLAVLCDR